MLETMGTIEHHMWFWIVIAVVFALIEVFTFSFGYLFASIAAFVAAGFSYFGASWQLCAVVFTVVLLLTLWKVRPWLMSKVQSKEQMKGPVENLLGQKAVIESIVEVKTGKYRVSVAGMDWAAQGPEGLNPGDLVKIEKSDGITLIITKG
jgi:membrane protein implicated in regulation of membrane protease activity